MLATGLEYGIRVLWTGAGVCAMTLGAASETDWAVRLVMLLCGILTLLLSILLGGFVKHIVGHEAYSRTLYAELDRREQRLFQALHGTVNEAQCQATQKGMAAASAGQLDLVRQRLSVLECRLDAWGEGHGRAAPAREPQN
jgi:hypothetical protein